MTFYPKQIIDALSRVRYPGSGLDIVSAGMVGDDIRISGNNISFSITFAKANDPFIKSVVKAAEQSILTYAGREAVVDIHITYSKAAEAEAESSDPLPDVRNTVAISSGKGGVGKSTVAANLAVALSLQGYAVGLLDADISGPSIPKMFGLEGMQPRMVSVEGRDMIEPAERYGVKVLSIGFFVGGADAVLWRGAMASNALRQLITEGAWGALDYLLIDLPPGTGDVHLTMLQTIALTGAVVVTTPQDVAVSDARRGISMFKSEKIAVPVLGIVENMSWFTPPELPDRRYYIFGNGGGQRLASETGIPFLGSIPVEGDISASSDGGSPLALDKNSAAGEAYRLLALSLDKNVSHRNEHLPATGRIKIKHT
ncbi:MAG: Mrp/NBP35 family ATP-binding protein [Tannerellaceae bacterium]|jgi:ATP-binding protein involved in chromosome partitioning|nr:Mrp/NBP35 family ATP-binding protein [Tannerellaceae bacterium]